MLKFKTSLQSTSGLVDLTPLVDVIFLMLIFFIITSDVLPLKSLNIENPSLEQNSGPLTTQLLVVMDANHVLYVGSKKAIVDPAFLKEYLQEEVGRYKKYHSGAEPTVVLSVDRRVEYGPFLRLFCTTQQCVSKVRLVYFHHEEET